MNKVILTIDENDYISFESIASDHQLTGYSTMVLRLNTGLVNYVIAYYELEFILHNLYVMLKEVLKNNFIIDASIQNDIGFMWNELLHDRCIKSDFKIVNDAWIGERYLLWSLPSIQPRLTTWLYNDVQGNIVLHVTESYFWHYLDKSQGKNYITYSEFMKNYKPTFSCIIPHQTARQWLAQCEYLLAMVKENEARETREHDLARANGTCKECLEKR